MMATQQDPQRPSIGQTGGTRPPWCSTTGGGRWEEEPDCGFDDMNIPAWVDYVAARTAALGRLSRLGTGWVESSVER